MDLTGINSKEDIKKKIEEFKEKRKQIEAIEASPEEKAELAKEITELEKKIAALEVEQADIAKETDVSEKARREKRNKDELYEAREALMSAKSKQGQALMSAKSKQGQAPQGNEEFDKTIKDAQRRIEQYEEMLKENDSSMDYVQSARQQGTIKQLIKEEQDKIKVAEEQKKALNEKMNSADGKRKKMELFDEEVAFFTQTAMKFQKEVDALKLDMQIALQRGVTNPTYIYEGVTNERKAQLDEMIQNGTDMRHLEVNAMQSKLNELQEAINLCNEQKAIIKDEFKKMIEPVQKILDETYGKAKEEGEPGGGTGPEGGPGSGTGPEGGPGSGTGPEGGPGSGTGPEGGPGSGTGPEGGPTPPAKLDGEAYYKALNPWERYKMKKEAYEFVNGEKPEGLLAKIGLMLPRPKLTRTLIRNLSNGEIKPIAGKVPVQTEPPKEEPPKKEPEPQPEFGSLSEEDKAKHLEAQRKLAEEARVKNQMIEDFKKLSPEEQAKALQGMGAYLKGQQQRSNEDGHGEK